jgi:ubiquinone/menaquinone biosynthesis C-methylase UbiE
MDSFIAALKVGTTGRVVGVDMTDAQLEKASSLAASHAIGTVNYRKGYIEDTGLPGESFDCVISNGVINLAADKTRVFQEVARLLKPGGRLALADIVTEVPLPENVVCNTDLWAACIGGAEEQQTYRSAMETAGLVVERAEENDEYRFVSERAQKATAKWGVKSVSILARKR